MSEQDIPNKNIYLEAASGAVPSMDLLSKEFQSDNAIYVDKNFGFVRQISQQEGERIQASVDKLPLAENSIKTLVAKDYVGSDLPESEKTAVSGPIPSLDKTAEEWFRVLEPGGKALILEVSSPEVHPAEEVSPIFQEAGFEVEHLYEGRDIANVLSTPGFESGNRPRDKEDKRYALVLHKP